MIEYEGGYAEDPEHDEQERDWHQEWKDDQMQPEQEEPPEDYGHEFDQNGEHSSTCGECAAAWTERFETVGASLAEPPEQSDYPPF